MNNISRFGAIFQMQQSLAGNLSKVVARNTKVDVTVASKNYSAQSYAAVQERAKLLQNKHNYNLQKRVKS